MQQHPVLPLAALTLLTVAAAQAAEPLQLVLRSALVLTVKDGKTTREVLTPAPKTVRPGDLLQDAVTAANTGKNALQDVGVILPIPRGTHYTGTATPGTARAALEFSADGGNAYATAPLTRLVTVTEAGKTVTKRVTIPENEYTHVRWTIRNLAPAEKLTFSARFRVR